MGAFGSVNCGLPLSLTCRVQMRRLPVSSTPKRPAVKTSVWLAWLPASTGVSGVIVTLPISAAR